MSTEFNFVIMDANQHVEKQQALVRQLVSERIDLNQFKRRSPLPLPPPLGGRTRRTGRRGGHRRMNAASKSAIVFTATASRGVKAEELAAN